jgi:biopolymer transport protein ExbB
MSFDTLLELLALGGPVVAILLLMSIYSLSIVLLKLWQFRAVRLGDRRFLQPALEAWCDGDASAAIRATEGSPNPLARALSLLMRGLEAGIDRDTLREEVSRHALRDINILRRHFRPLEVIGNTAPLLGLLGTVIGMIAAFSQLEAAGSQVDPSVLSGGIWEALLTTAVGLVVAIPAVALLNYLERCVERLQEDMQDALARVFTGPACAQLIALTRDARCGERTTESATVAASENLTRPLQHAH